MNTYALWKSKYNGAGLVKERSKSPHGKMILRPDLVAEYNAKPQEVIQYHPRVIIRQKGLSREELNRQNIQDSYGKLYQDLLDKFQRNNGYYHIRPEDIQRAKEKFEWSLKATDEEIEDCVFWDGIFKSLDGDLMPNFSI